MLLATGILFQKDRRGHLTRHAIILQNILRYSLKIEKNKQINQKELSDWLAHNCSSFEFAPHTPERNKWYKVLKDKDAALGLEQLKRLGLIRQIGALEGNGTDVFAILQYTDSGRLLALIIDNEYTAHKALKEIYEILLLYHSSNKSSQYQFALRLLTIYYKQGRLEDLTEVVRNILERVTFVQYTDIRDIYRIIKISYFIDKVKAQVFLDNWKKAMNDLDPITRNLLLHDIKLESEARMADYEDIEEAASYEYHRFELRGNPKELALQGRCTRCSVIQNLSYNTKTFLVSLNDKPLDIKCPNCGENNCIVIPSL
jgi:hypothetical protein